jgi:hypothetical protein
MKVHISGAAFLLIAATLFSTPSLAARCDKNIADYWRAGTYQKIEGEQYWLSSVFTIDKNKDKRIDNIGFRLTNSDGNMLVLFYFAPKGELSGRSLKPFRLPDESVIPTLCFGKMSFELPSKDRWASEFPNLSAEIGKSIHGNKKKTVEADTTQTVWIGILFGAPAGLLLGGMVAYLIVRKRRRDDDDEDEDEEDDDEFSDPR